MKNAFSPINIHVWHDSGAWHLTVLIDSRRVTHERTQRDYSSSSDAITSARHLVNEVTQAKGAKKS